MKIKYVCDNGRHLICEPYTIENLHIMAKELDIRRHWFHKSKSGLYHYDIPKKRVEEIKSKCEVVETKEIIRIIRSETNKQENIVSVKA